MEINPKDLLAHTDFIGVPLWLASRKELSWGAKVVFSRLVYLLARGSIPTQEEVGEDLGLSQKTVAHYIQELKSKGILKVMLCEKGTWDRTAKYTIVNQPWFPTLVPHLPLHYSRDEYSITHPLSTQEQEHKEQKEPTSARDQGSNSQGKVARLREVLGNLGVESSFGWAGDAMNTFGEAEVVRVATENRDWIVKARKPTSYLWGILKKGQKDSGPEIGEESGDPIFDLL